MKFNGRWVPIEVMDAIILLWAIAAIVLCLILYRVARPGKLNKPDQVKSPATGQKRRKGRKR